MYLIIFFIEIFILFLLSKNISKKFYTLLYGIFKNKRFAIYAYSVLFLPGTFIHEFSHFLIALVMLVPVGSVELLPKIEGDHVRLGSVEIAKTDLVRNVIIGLAPMIVGIGLIVCLVDIISSRGLLGNIWYLSLLSYLIFEIGNTMYSSKKDLDGALVLFLFIVIVLGIWFLLLFKFHIDLPEVKINPSLNKSIGVLDLLMLIPIGVDLLVLFVFRFVDYLGDIA